MKILVFDNYDSFTYNLVHLVEKITRIQVEVFRNDELPLQEVKRFDKIILSPGPGIPEEAGSLLDLIREYAPSKPILGVCLGHQAIGQCFGAQLVNLREVYHGVATDIVIESPEISLFRGLPRTLEVGRYHSWVVSGKEFPDTLEITARDSMDQIMALRHKTFDVQGVQFHPESVLTPMGEKILYNWLNA